MRHPLVRSRPSDAPVAWRGGRPIGVRAFVADASALAARLPGRGPVVNLCVDRYRFAVGFAATLIRGRTSLLPPNALDATLAQLAAPGERLVGLADDPALLALPAPSLALVQVDADGTVSIEGDAAVPSIDGALPAASLLTSGSTGTPKPHRKTWGALAANVAAAVERLAALTGRTGLDGPDRLTRLTLVATVPPQHSYGFESTVLLALLGGPAFDAGRPFYPADVAAALDGVPRPRALVTTPFHLKTVVASGVALPPCDLILSATAPLSPQLAQRAERAFEAPLVEIYGCTEAGQVATRRTVDGDVWTTFGALRVRVDAEGGAVVAGGHVVDPTPLADVIEPLDAPDEPDQAPGRRFRLLGRAGDVIHVAGRRSSLAHLNFHLNSIDGVADGAFWMPEDVADGVVRPVAFVVAPTLDAAEIAAALKRRIEPAFVPRRIVKVDALPRAATGKLTADALARLASCPSS